MCSLLISDNCRKKHRNSHLMKGKAQQAMNQNLEKNRFFSEKVRDFDLIRLKQEQSNLVLGSSIIGKLGDDATIPLDSYPCFPWVNHQWENKSCGKILMQKNLKL